MEDTNTALWRLRRRLEYLEGLQAAPNTAIVTLLLRPEEQIIKIRQMLHEELAQSSNIKNGARRSSVQEALRAISEHLKPYKKAPTNGLACFFASSVLDPKLNKEFKLKLFFDVPRPVPKFVYSCDSDFKLDILKSMLHDDRAIGFIVVDGNGALFATVRGNS